MIFVRNDVEIFRGVFDCVDLGDLPDAVSEGVRAFQLTDPTLTKLAPLGCVSIDLTEVGGTAGGTPP
jgi:hypothetical protein